MAAACTSWRSSRRSSAPHRITTTARRDGDDWILNGAKTYISGVDVASNVLVVARTEDSTTGALKPVLFVVPTGAAGLEYTKIEMDIISADRQFSVFLDDVRLPADALVGAEDAAIDQLFAGLNPERIMASAFAVGMARYALGVATEYAKERVVWRDKPIGSHQGVAHPLAQAHIEVQLAKLMMQKAATLYDQGDHMGAGEAANMAKHAAGEAGTPGGRSGGADSGWQRPGQRIRAGRTYRSIQAVAHRAGQSGDDPQLRRPAQPGPAKVVLMDTSPSTDPSSAEAPLVLRHDADRIATLTLDSPENRNALSARLVGELAGHLRDIEADDTVRAVVLTHTSNTFCAGADLAEGAREGGPAKGVARLVALLRQIVELDKPVVAKVEGNVRAGGLGLFCGLRRLRRRVDVEFCAHQGPAGPVARGDLADGVGPPDRPGGVAVLPHRRPFRRCRGGTYRAGHDRNRGSRRGGRRVGGVVPEVFAAGPGRLQTARHPPDPRNVRFRCGAADREVRCVVLVGGCSGGHRVVSGAAATELGRVTNTEPPLKGPKQDRSRATRPALLEAAVGSLAEVGWSGNTVTVVAERRGVSRRAAQRHFPTREDLFIAAVEHMTEARTGEIRRYIEDHGDDPISTRNVVQLVVDMHTGELFRAALALWVASAAEPQLRERVVTLETRIGRQVHRATVQLLGVDEQEAGVRPLIQGILDMARGLGLANLLGDDRQRRAPIIAQWSALLDGALDRSG